MWSQAASAWYEGDATLAEQLDERDDELDTLHVALVAELAAGQMPLPVTMDMTLVARFYERLGDHAVNVARRVGSISKPSAPESQF
jgi:phosphate transport system protein